MKNQQSTQSTEMRESEPAVSRSPDFARILRSLLPTLLINALLPLLIFELMTNVLHQPAFLSLLATGVPSTLMALIGIIRKRRIDFLAGIALLGIVVGLLVSLLSNDPRLLLIRDSFFTTGFGLTFLISLLFPKPLIYYLARTFTAGNDPILQQRYATRWQQDGSFRRRMRVQSTIWGIGLFLEAVARISLVFLLPTAQFLALSPFAQWGVIGATFIVSRFASSLRHKPAMKGY